MEDVNGSILGHSLFHIRKGIQQELIEGIIIHVIVLNLTSSAFVVDVVRRVGYHQICFLSSHQHFIGFSFSAVSAVKTVGTKAPKVTSLGDEVRF